MATVGLHAHGHSRSGGASAVVEQLFARHARLVYRHCLRTLGSPEEAEDAVQETYLKAWRSLERGFSPAAPVPWLLRIARNLCVSRHRARAARLPTEPLRETDLPGLGPDLQRNQLFGLSEALAQLPEAQRRAFILREWRGLDLGEVADALDVSYAAAATQVSRARRSVAADLAEAADVPPPGTAPEATADRVASTA